MAQQLVPQHGELTPIGLKLAPDLSFEAWLDLGEKIIRVQAASAWALGDWLLAGEFAYGRRYEEGMALTGLAYSTLANLKYVAGRFQFSRRRENLSHSHHLLVARLPFTEADEWLDLAEREELSYHELQLRVAAHHSLPKASVPSKPSNGRDAAAYHTIRQVVLEVDGERYERWSEAAGAEGLNEWLGRLADEAC